VIKLYLKPHLFVYILECLVGLCICYTLYQYFPQHQFFWSIVSVVLVIAPDGVGSNKLAFNRMKANILGSSIGLLLFMIHQPNLLLICIALTLTILIGVFLKLDAALRPALAALIIVMIHEQHQNSTQHIALERVGCVMFGCVTGLLITFFFNWAVPLVKKHLKLN